MISIKFQQNQTSEKRYSNYLAFVWGHYTIFRPKEVLTHVARENGEEDGSEDDEDR